MKKTRWMRLYLAGTVLFSLSGLLSAQSSEGFKGDREGHRMRDVIPKRDIPAAPILSVEQALGAFRVQPGFVVEPVASEPNVFNPVALSFDAKGRIWVAEMTTYMPDVHGKGEMAPEGNVAVLSDTDGDGELDKRTVFLSDIVLPRTVAMVEGGIFYADQTSLYFVEVLEEKGRLYPGLHEVVDAEYASGGSLEHKPNTMLYGMDHWYYNAKSDQRYRVLRHSDPLPHNSKEIYRNHLWKLVKANTDYRGQWGLSMDDYGRLYHNGNSSPVHGEYLLPGALSRNPGYWPDAPAHSIGGNRVYPARMNPGVNRGYLDGVLIESGKDRGKLVNFTAASGSLVYRGSNFPPAYYGMALTPEPAANLISAREVIEKEGKLTGEPIYPGAELLTSVDERFRPVNLYNAPDGTVYIADMYHGILQHREFLTSYLAAQIEHRDLDKNNNTMGRIYRLRWQESDAAAVPDMSELSLNELVPFLFHENAWQRDTARRLLVQRHAGDETAAAITGALKASDNVAGIINALWTLAGLNALDLKTVERYIRHPDHWVAMTAAAAGESLPEADSEAYLALLKQLAKAGYPRALQAAVSVAAVTGGQVVSRYVLDHYLDKPYTREAVVSGLGDEADAFLASVDGYYPDERVMYLLNNLGKRRQDASNRAQLDEAGQTLFDQGRGIYAGKGGCANCHGPNGRGQNGLGPGFWDSEWVAEQDRLIKVLLHGLSGPIEVAGWRWDTPAVMPGFAARADLTERDLAAVATFIRNSWGNTGSPITPEKVKQLRRQTEDRREPYRAEDFQ